MRLVGLIFFVLAWLSFFNVLKYSNDPHHFVALGLAIVASNCWLQADVRELEKKVDRLEKIR